MMFGLEDLKSGGRIYAQNILPLKDFLDVNLRTIRIFECYMFSFLLIL